ncbi:MAG: WD40 repeat domain-containing protein, partial [Phycisphaerales bacterium]|nr:WD40 repeat domain-containing protein [Phycisphaerales bacterium]
MAKGKVLRCMALFAPVSSVAMAQCDPHWLPGEGIRGLNGQVAALAQWDPDGPGPSPAVLLAGGSFSIAGDAFVSNLAAWDASTQSWYSVGGGTDGRIAAIATLPDGSFIVGGSFTHAGSVAVAKVARWNPATSSWSALGVGLNDDVRSLTLTPSGELVAGGNFTAAGGAPASRIALWNFTTSSWSALGAGVNNFVSAVAVLPGGDILAGGRFSSAGGAPAANIARWNPATSTWSAFGSGTGNALISAIAVLPGGAGDFVVGGSFTTAGGNAANRVARWNEATSTWSALGTGVTGSAGGSGSVVALALSADGVLFVGGTFGNAGGQSANNVASWDLATSTWSPLGRGTISAVRSLLAGNAGIVVGGDFQVAGDLAASHIALWQTSAGAWAPFGSEIYGSTTDLVTLPDGDIVAARSYMNAANGSDFNVVRRDAATGAWSSLGTGMDGRVLAVEALPDAVDGGGDIIAGGNFRTAGGTSALNIARWSASESAWKAMGAGFSSAVIEVAVSPAGEIIASGQLGRSGTQTINCIARWDASAQQWKQLGSGLTRTGGGSASASGLAFLADGDIVAAGLFTHAGGVPASNIARWDTATSSWSAIGAGISAQVGRVIVLENGDLIASTFDRVFRWTDSSAQWTSIGTFAPNNSLAVYRMLARSGGDFLVAGDFSAVNGVSARNIVRWNNADSSWHAVGTGVTSVGAASHVEALTPLPDGFAAGGDFAVAGEYVSANFAHFSETNTPWVAEQPAPATLIAGDTLTLQSTPAAASSGVMARW